MNNNDQNTAPTWKIAIAAHSKKKRERAAAALPELKKLLEELRVKVASTPRCKPHHLEAAWAVREMNGVRTAIYAALLTAHGKPVSDGLRLSLSRQIVKMRKRSR